MSMESSDKGSAHQRRAEEDLARRKVPAEGGETIEMPDLNTSVPIAGTRPVSDSRPESARAVEESVPDAVYGKDSVSEHPDSDFRMALKKLKDLQRQGVPRKDLIVLSSRGLVPDEKWKDYEGFAKRFLREGKEKKTEASKKDSPPAKDTAASPEEAREEPLSLEDVSQPTSAFVSEPEGTSLDAPQRAVGENSYYSSSWTGRGERPPETPQHPPQEPPRHESVPPESGSEHGEDPFNVDPRRYVGIKIKPIREVLANKRDAQLFGEVLGAINPEAKEAVLQRYSDGNPTPEDVRYMTYAAHEYSRNLKFAEETNKMIAKEDIERLAQRDPVLLDLLTHEGDRAFEMVQNAILHMSMRNYDGVKGLRDAFKELSFDRDTYRHKKIERGIEDVCKRLGVERKDYEAIYDPRSSRKVSLQNMTSLIRERAGKFRRTLDWVDDKIKVVPISIPGSSEFAASRILRKADKVTPPGGGRSLVGMTSKSLRARIDDNLAYIAEYLAPTIGNAEMRKLVAEEVLSNENQELNSGKGPQSFAEVQELGKKEVSVQSIEKRIQNHIKSDPQWTSRTRDERSGILNGMKDDEMRKRKEGLGFWASILLFLLSGNWDKASSSALQAA